MGILPTGSGDWLQFETRLEVSQALSVLYIDRELSRRSPPSGLAPEQLHLGSSAHGKVKRQKSDKWSMLQTMHVFIQQALCATHVLDIIYNGIRLAKTTTTFSSLHRTAGDEAGQLLT